MGDPADKTGTARYYAGPQGVNRPDYYWRHQDLRTPTGGAANIITAIWISALIDRYVAFVVQWEWNQIKDNDGFRRCAARCKSRAC